MDDYRSSCGAMHRVLWLLIGQNQRQLGLRLGGVALFLSGLMLIAPSVSAATLSEEGISQVAPAEPATSHSVTLSITQIVAGQNHSCLLTSAGSVMCWGRNHAGQLGTGNKVDQLLPVDVTGLASGVAKLTAGDNHTCALTQSGGMFCWGENINGQVGDGTTTDRTVPTPVAGLAADVAEIIGGYRHSCAVLNGGGVKCWGLNTYGAVGDGTTTNRTTPQQVQGLSNGVKSLAAGGLHTCALLTTGSVKCWGRNDRGQMGDGTFTDRLTPVTVTGFASGIAAVAAENAHTCALTNTSGLKCWGWNANGQIGDGTTTNRNVPTNVTGLTTGVSAISTLGDKFSCALTTANGVKCWGLNEFGQLGDGTNIDRATPVNVVGLSSDVAALAPGDFHVCARMMAGDLKCWGRGQYGQLGENAAVDRSLPVDVQLPVNEFSCSQQSAVRGRDCDALVDLYNGTNGDDWHDNSDWLTPSSSPCDWYGVVCTTIGSETWVTELLLQSNNLTGSIPASLGTLTEMTELSLYSNAIQGSIPASLGDLAALTALRLGHNQLTGPIPAELGSLTNLEILGLDDNQLIGTIPLELGDLTKLTLFNLDRNQLTGPVPATFGNFAQITRLWLENNKLEGNLPQEIGSLGQLVQFSIANNRLAGEIPESFQSLSKLSKLNLTYNALYAGSSALNSFIDARNPGWAATQTIPPSAFAVGQVQQADVQLVWTPIAYAGDGGAYMIQYGTVPGGPYPFSAQTNDKVADSIWISGLTPNTDYYFVAMTHTPAHDNQQNAVTSESTQEISATTLHSGSGSVDCYLLRRSHQGQGDELAAIPTSSTGCDAGKYVAGEALTLFANPATDWRIGSWSGTDDDTGTGTTNALTMPANSHDVAVEYVQLPIVTFAAAELSLPEGSGRAQIHLRLNKITPAPLAVTVTSENGSATGGTDFVQLNRAVTFAPGSQEASFEFEVLDDSADEGNETLTLRLSAPQGLILGTATATIIIGDDDSTSGGDVYENDNSCADFSVIATDGTVQRHTFHQANDQDWVRFDVAEQQDYLVQVSVPPDSPADVIIDLRLECDSLPVQSQGYTFSPGARLDFRAPRSGPIYVRLLDNDPLLGTSQAIYDLAVRHLQRDAQVGAAIVVAGSIKQNDPVQPNIYNVTDAAYQMFLDNGYDADRILYLAPDLSHDPVKVDLLANVDNLRNGITQWAKSRVDAERALTIYLMDHGDQDRLYLDKERLQWIEPDDLDAMLDQLEAEVEGLKVNVIIEACYSGSFISGASSISKPGRVIVTSVDDENLAWASTTGAYFSDHFIAALRRGESLYTSFNTAKAAVQTAHPTQIAWIDADGDASALDDASQSPAAQRGFSMPGTFPPSRWPPFVAEVDEAIQVEDGVALLRARVVDDEDGVSVHAVIYGPGYEAPTTGEEMILESTQVLQTVVLLDQGKDWYGVNYPGFRDPGTYRIVIYAQDRSGTQGQPRTIELVVEGIPSPLDKTNLYLPLLRR